METETIVMCVGFFIVGIIIFYLLRNSCGCNVVEGQDETPPAESQLCSNIPIGGGACQFWPKPPSLPDENGQCATGYCAGGESNCKDCGGNWFVMGSPPVPPPVVKPVCNGQPQSDLLTVRRKTPAPDVFGYYGNSEGDVAGQVNLEDIPDVYNVLVLTFLLFDKNGNFYLSIQGNYAPSSRSEGSLLNFQNALKAWKLKPDPYGRQKHILLSIGGASFQKDNLPNLNTIEWYSNVEPGKASTISSDISEYPTKIKLIEGYEQFIDYFDPSTEIIDGIDLDMEGSNKNSQRLQLCATQDTHWIEFLNHFKIYNYVYSCAPEADNGSCGSYYKILKANLFTWYNIQFYNNKPSQINNQPFSTDIPCTDNDSPSNGLGIEWATFGIDPPQTWQDENSSGKSAFEFVVENIFSDRTNFHNTKFGVLVPGSDDYSIVEDQGGLVNCYDFNKFAYNVSNNNNIDTIGTWCIEQDVLLGNLCFTNQIKQLLTGTPSSTPCKARAPPPDTTKIYACTWNGSCDGLKEETWASCKACKKSGNGQTCMSERTNPPKWTLKTC